MQGREPQGVIPASEYESFQNEMKARLEALPGENGQAMKSLVFKRRKSITTSAT
jgi:predicted AlkP superfamily phosphohydrolase/phosphomutase